MKTRIYAVPAVMGLTILDVFEIVTHHRSQSYQVLGVNQSTTWFQGHNKRIKPCPTGLFANSFFHL